jgi:hypothetical protein
MLTATLFVCQKFSSVACGASHRFVPCSPPTASDHLTDLTSSNDGVSSALRGDPPAGDSVAVYAVVGVVAGLLLIGAAVFFVIMSRRKRDEENAIEDLPLVAPEKVGADTTQFETSMDHDFENPVYHNEFEIGQSFPEGTIEQSLQDW